MRARCRRHEVPRGASGLRWRPALPAGGEKERDRAPRLSAATVLDPLAAATASPATDCLIGIELTSSLHHEATIATAAAAAASASRQLLQRKLTYRGDRRAVVRAWTLPLLLLLTSWPMLPLLLRRSSVNEAVATEEKVLDNGNSGGVGGGEAATGI